MNNNGNISELPPLDTSEIRRMAPNGDTPVKENNKFSYVKKT